VQHGAEGRRTELTLESTVDERVIDRRRQIVNQHAVLGGALDMVDQELQHGRCRDGQGEGDSVP